MSVATLAAIVAVLVPAGLYLGLGWRLHRQVRRADDVLPLTSLSNIAKVGSAAEFNAATVAPTISLATVILAFAELAPSMGTWLLWTVVTTSAGILAVRLFARHIWKRMRSWTTDRPTLHGFLGESFESPTLKVVASFSTTLGFLGAFAVELTVGTKFLATLMPAIPEWLAILMLATLGVGYTILGGFRAVILSDRIQMWAIWASIFALLMLIAMKATSTGGALHLLHAIPHTVYDFSWRDGLAAFILGIFVMNVPTFLADMSVWQRIMATREETVVARGLVGSALTAAASWGALVLIACALVGLVTRQGDSNLLFVFLMDVARQPNITNAIAFTVVVAGLYAASLSTVSTQLVAAAHTIHTDLLGIHRDHALLRLVRNDVILVRLILLFGAAVSVAIVLALTVAGFSIADLVFAIYGAQLGLVPAVMLALLVKPEQLARLKTSACVAVAGGFVVGWGCAGLGKYFGNDNLIFLAPAASLAWSASILMFGWIGARNRAAQD